MLGGAKSVYYADAFKKGLTVTIMERKISNPVRKQEQKDILDALHANCAEYYKAVFGKKSSDETEDEHKQRWGVFNDTLRKMIFGTYVGPRLPVYFVTEFNSLQCPQWKSFFIQRVLVYHNHLKTKLPKMDPSDGIVNPSKKIKKMELSDFNSIALPAAIQAPAPLPPPPPQAPQPPPQAPPPPPHEPPPLLPADQEEEEANEEEEELLLSSEVPVPPSRRLCRVSMPKTPPEPGTGGVRRGPGRGKDNAARRMRRGKSQKVSILRAWTCPDIDNMFRGIPV
jgi:hypothetical protein